MPHVSDPEFKKEVGDRLRRTRYALEQPNQSRFATSIDITKSRLSNYELGTRMLDPAVAVTICERYKGVTLDWLYMNDPERLPSWLTARLFGIKFADMRRA